jgi:hypothetical protein
LGKIERDIGDDIRPYAKCENTARDLQKSICSFQYDADPEEPINPVFFSQLSREHAALIA